MTKSYGDSVERRTENKGLDFCGSIFYLEDSFVKKFQKRESENNG